jgi:hypothetical protein
MLFEEVIPHLNKMATVYYKNKRRRTGFIFTDSVKKQRSEIYFVTMMRGRKLIETPRAKDMEKLKRVTERIPLSEIERIRTSR